MAENGAQPEEPGITGAAPLYRKPEPLSAARHGKLGIKNTPGQMLGFLEGAHFVPAVAAEFYYLCRHYPIVFAGEDCAPLAVMGLREGQNVFLGDDGLFEPFAYVPGYIRRYPFAFATNPDNDQAIVCIDSAYEAITDAPDLAFFEGDQPTDYIKQTMEFLQAFERDRLETIKFVETLKEMDLFGEMQSDYNTPAQGDRPASTVRVATFRGVPDERMRALDGKKLTELRERNYLGLIYAHQISLLNWSALVNRSVSRGLIDPPAQAGAPAPAQI